LKFKLSIIPDLKTFEIFGGPSSIAYAIIHLTAIKKIQRLDSLEIQYADLSVPECNLYSSAVLESYHRRIRFSLMSEWWNSGKVHKIDEANPTF